MLTRISLAMASVVVCSLAATASAQEFCVTCSAPDATYRCIVGGEPGIATTTSRGQLLCITELARSGGHASCSVGRRTSTEPCQGEVRTVMFPSPPADVPPPPTEAQSQARPPEGQGAPLAADGAALEPPPPAEAPQTVESLTKDTVQKSGEGLKKAGEAVTDTAQSAGQAIGNAAQKTWKCLSSLFSDC